MISDKDRKLLDMFLEKEISNIREYQIQLGKLDSALKLQNRGDFVKGRIIQSLFDRVREAMIVAKSKGQNPEKYSLMLDSMTEYILEKADLINEEIAKR
jgi:hypothetical protein